MMGDKFKPQDFLPSPTMLGLQACTIDSPRKCSNESWNLMKSENNCLFRHSKLSHLFKSQTCWALAYCKPLQCLHPATCWMKSKAILLSSLIQTLTTHPSIYTHRSQITWFSLLCSPLVTLRQGQFGDSTSILPGHVSCSSDQHREGWNLLGLAQLVPGMKFILL